MWFYGHHHVDGADDDDDNVKMMAGPNVAEEDIGATVVHCDPLH